MAPRLLVACATLLVLVASVRVANRLVRGAASAREHSAVVPSGRQAADAKALVKVHDAVEDGLTTEIEPVSAVVVGVISGLISRGVYDAFSWVISEDSPVRTTRYVPRSISTLRTGEGAYPTTLWRYCHPAEPVEFSPLLKSWRTWVVHNIERPPWYRYISLFPYIPRRCRLDVSFRWAWEVAERIDCRDARSHPQYHGHHPDAAFRVYYHNLRMGFRLNGGSENTKAYAALGVALPSYPYRPSEIDARAGGAFVFYVEIGQDSICSDGRLWRFFFYLHNNHMGYFPPRNSWPGAERFSALPAFRRDGSRILGREGNKGMPNEW